LSATALITGIAGQDGSFLAELLLAKGYEVHGLVRRSSTDNLSRLSGVRARNLESNLTLHYGDLNDPLGLAWLVRDIRPSEVYHLAAQTDVGLSFVIPEETTATNAVGTLRMLEAVRLGAPDARFYNASSAEVFGRSLGPQSETTPFSPCSPYGYSKAFAYWATVNYRNAYGLHASNGIFFNHESERRGSNFVTQKIALAVAGIEQGKQETLQLGDLTSVRDWGYAPEYAEAMWLILQEPRPEDYVVATGEGHTVAEFCQLAFSEVGLDWSEYVESSSQYFRPEEPGSLVGDSRKAHKNLGWLPRTTFPQLVSLMVRAARERSGQIG